jgi:hypothetical protein
MHGLKIAAAGGLACAALLAASSALANDSSAELAAGGLVLTHSDGIEMRSEDLSLSREAVKVHYVFRNTTPRDVSVLVAFPMPPITGDIDFVAVVPTDDPVNILGFSTTVDGAPVKAEVEQRVFFKGREYTTLLKRWGIPLAPHLGATVAALDRLPKARQDQLLKLGLVDHDDYDAGKGWEHHLQPFWTLKTTYYWTQVFPAGRDLVVEHRYTPSVGQSAGSGLGMSWLKGKELADFRRKYCIDDAFMAAVDKVQARAGKDALVFTEARLDYILSSGGNWSRPIGDFHLSVDKGHADTLVSFCATGVRRTGPTRFESHLTDFRPSQDLHILFLDPAPQQ